MKREKAKGGKILSYLTPSAWLGKSDVRSGLFVYRVPVRLVPVYVFNGSRSRETEEGSVRQGLNVLQRY